MVEEMDQHTRITEQQAQAGLDYLRELRQRNNYWGAMWVPQIQERLECGEELADLMDYALNTGSRWLTQAGPRRRGELAQSLLTLFVVTRQDWTRYGYGAAA